MHRIDRIAGLLILPLLLLGLVLFVVYQLTSDDDGGASEVVGEGVADVGITTVPVGGDAVDGGADGDGGGSAGEGAGGADDGLAGSTTTADTTSTTTDDDPTATEPSTAEADDTDVTVPELPEADQAAPPQEPLGSFRDGRLVLRGSVPSADLAAAYAERAATVLGEENVTVEMQVDERVSGDTLTVDVDQEFRFPSGTTEFDPQFQPLLDLGVAALQLLPEATLIVTGHTDDIGDEGTNLALSQARAQIVVNWMVERGISPDRVVARGAGESEPIADNATPAGREANRRIEAVLVGVRPR